MKYQESVVTSAFFSRQLSVDDASSSDPFVSPCSDPVEEVSTVQTSMRPLASSFTTRLRLAPLRPVDC